MTELEDLAGWSSYGQARALFEAAASLLDDARALRRVGEGAARGDMTGEVAALLRSLGGPAELLENVGLAAAKFCTFVRMEATHVGEGFAMVRASNVEGFARYRLLCDFTAGMLSQVPIPFDLPPAAVTEVSCELDGHPDCVFRVEWEGERLRPEDAGTLAEELSLLAGRFDIFQATAADLVSATDVDEVLARITSRAGLAVRAPRHLLVVRPFPEADTQVHHTGFADAEEARALGEMLLGDDRPHDDHSSLIVDVASARRRYGLLAAISEPGTAFFPAERDLLAAYAGLAAAALDAATALEESRRQTSTAEALFDLARDLTSILSTEDVADRLAAAVVRTVDCDVAQIWLNEPDGLRMVAAEGVSAAEPALRPVAISSGDTEHLREMLDEPRPMLLLADNVDPFMAGLFSACGVVASLAVPVTLHGDLLAVIAVGVEQSPERLTTQRELTALLSGLADIAATAFQNARLVEQIRHQALYDAVTRLPNKRLLEERVRDAFARLRRTAEPFSLFFLDLDRFKKVNDTLGHGVGDRLLEEVGTRLSQAMREEDTVARLGGDEFAVLLPRASNPSIVERVAERVYEALQRPFYVDDQPIFITCSIGAAIAPTHGETYDALLRNADIAMYSAKEQGRNRCAVYSSALTKDFGQRLRLESDLHLAVTRNEFVIHYQPQIELSSRRTVGVEALVRWEHPELGLLSPDRFLPLAEETNLILDIDLHVLRGACRDASGWVEAGVTPMHVAVNVSHQSLLDPGFVNSVAEVLAETRLDPGTLEIEITENVVESNAGHVLDAMHRLRELGVRLAIDDFGTGNSGLARLRAFPIDTLKIDRSFVAEVAGGANALLAAMTRLGEDLGFTVVAEGVETQEQLEFLQRQPCHHVQGYLFSRPLPHAALSQYLRDSRMTAATQEAVRGKARNANAASTPAVA